MSMKRGLLRTTEPQLQAATARGPVSRPNQPNTQRGIPRVHTPPPAQASPRDTAPQHDTSAPAASPRDTAPQHDTSAPAASPPQPRMGVRLRALTPPPRATLPFSPDPEATLSYDGNLLARGFDFEARRQATMPLSPQDLERLGVPPSPPPSQRDTQPNALPSNVIPLPPPRAPSPSPHPDLDLGRARRDTELSGLIELPAPPSSALPWVIAGLGAGFGILGLAIALL